MSETTKNLVLIVVAMLSQALILVGAYCAALYSFSVLPRAPNVVDFQPTIQVQPAPVEFRDGVVEVKIPPIEVQVPQAQVMIERIRVPQVVQVPAPVVNLHLTKEGVGLRKGKPPNTREYWEKLPEPQKE